MIEILPIRLLRDDDATIFGSLNVSLGKLERVGLPVAPGIVVTPPDLHLKTIIEHFDFGSKDVFQQSLTLVKKELSSTPIPKPLQDELKSHKEFFLNGKSIDSVKGVWMVLLEIWIEEIRQRLWKDGFSKGITENLEPQIVIFSKKINATGKVHGEGDEIAIEISNGELEPSQRKRLLEITKEANKKLFIPHTYEWILDGSIKLTRVLPYTPGVIVEYESPEVNNEVTALADLETSGVSVTQKKSTIKVFHDLSDSLSFEPNADGIYIASEKIFDLNRPRESFEELVIRIVEAATTFPESPVLVKLADQSEGLPAGRQGMGGVRGTLRLLHQQSLLGPLIEALDFVRHKKGLTNVHIVIPFVRSPRELSQIKRNLAVKKLMRKNSLEQWLEIAVPENIINLDEYLTLGVDGVVLNLDELAAYFGGYDHTNEELQFYNHEVIASFAYKNEVSGLLKFLEDGIKLLHKASIPFIAYGSLSMYPQVLEYLVSKGVWGVVVERYEAHSIHDLLRWAEKRLILRKLA